MKIEIITTPYTKDIYGFSGTAINKDYVGTAFKLTDKVWKIVKTNNLKNKGLNNWVYEPGEMVFAGIELEVVPGTSAGLERKHIEFLKYAYFKHVGPYHLIRHAGEAMQKKLTDKGFETSLPYLEVYGHWTNDETQLETELFMCLK